MLALYAKGEKKKTWENVCSVIWSNLFSNKELQTIPEGLDAFLHPPQQYSVKETFVLCYHPYQYTSNSFLFAQGYVQVGAGWDQRVFKTPPPNKGGFWT